MTLADFGFQWHLTHQCNARCAHCYQETYTDEAPGTLGQALVLAEKIFSHLRGVPITVNLTGGEPFLVPYLSDLVCALDAYEQTDTIHIITNGTLIVPEALQVLRRVKKNGAMKVSLESGDSALNDRIRGAGHFARVNQGIDAFQQAGFEVVLMVTLAKYNVAAIDETIRFARHRGLTGILFERFVPLGAGQKIRDQVIDEALWQTAITHIGQASEFDGDASELFPYTAFWLDLTGLRDDVLLGAECNLGESSMALMPDGTVYPCRRLPISLGNLHKESFATLHERLTKMDFARLVPSKDSPCGPCLGCQALTRAKAI